MFYSQGNLDFWVHRAACALCALSRRSNSRSLLSRNSVRTLHGTSARTERRPIRGTEWWCAARTEVGPDPRGGPHGAPVSGELRFGDHHAHRRRDPLACIAGRDHRHFLYVKKRKKENIYYSPYWLIDSSSYCWVLLYIFAILMKQNIPNKA